MKKTKRVDTKKSNKNDVKSPQPKIKTKPEEAMDRAALKGIVGQLKAAGSDIKAFKSDTDEVLQRKVNEELQKLPSAEVLKMLESVDPTKLVSVLKRDCFGIFIDLSDVSCVRCADAASCVTTFLKNLQSPLDLERAMPDDVKPKAASVVAPPPVTRYEPKRLVFVRDVSNPNPKDDDYYDTIQRVLAEQPDTLKELRVIVEQEFDLDSDADFMKFVTAMRDPAEGVIKLDVDLSESDKVALRAAGYEV